ncbi:hypothetical protein E4V99_04850 [Microbacterium sp. dk485]|uniref:DUF6385 domain-containing protein n=1 Tax=Microbacterium sp. dk485 TaxID=2560021 RepID=UPI0010746FEA|nr:DUF6385 domain-containing protein [Microbacterium sp. dk485]TFV84395.1 hypothetical protein E4V99_04850 [Microbacterium sp. dk485]
MTEPFEAGWAGEARWYVHFLKGSPSSEVALQVQISPDGLNWIDHESPEIHTPAVGLATITVRAFGLWLRLKTARTTGADEVLLRIYLELKE